MRHEMCIQELQVELGSPAPSLIAVQSSSGEGVESVARQDVGPNN